MSSRSLPGVGGVERSIAMKRHRTPCTDTPSPRGDPGTASTSTSLCGNMVEDGSERFTRGPQSSAKQSVGVKKRRTGLEPATNGLEGRYSTIELPPHVHKASCVGKYRGHVGNVKPRQSVRQEMVMSVSDLLCRHRFVRIPSPFIPLPYGVQ